MASRIRQNFKEESEALINKQINMEFYASYVYMSMYAYFDRDDQAMPGFAAFFKKSSEEERAHGLKLVEYQNKRGGKVVFQDIARPSATEWGTPLEALEAALELSVPALAGLQIGLCCEKPALHLQQCSIRREGSSTLSGGLLSECCQLCTGGCWWFRVNDMHLKLPAGRVASTRHSSTQDEGEHFKYQVQPTSPVPISSSSEYVQP